MARKTLNDALFDAANRQLDGPTAAEALAQLGAARARVGEAATTNAAVVKAGKTKLLGYTFTNLAATTRFVKLYNKATAPAPGTDTGATVLLLKIAVPPNSTVTDVIPYQGIDFALGLGIATTAAAADNDATVLTAANEVMGHVFYL